MTVKQTQVSLQQGDRIVLSLRVDSWLAPGETDKLARK